MTASGRATEARWDPEQYQQFREERAEPFRDLAALVERERNMEVVDLGCGPGDMTVWLHDKLNAAHTLGIDSSEEMLAAASQHGAVGIRFEREDIWEFATKESPPAHDLIFSNAALQWVGAHEDLFANLAKRLRPRGQLAVQVPVGSEQPAGHILAEIAAEEPYARLMAPHRRSRSTLTADRYARLLYDLGFEKRNVRMQVYGHVLDDARMVVEWFKGSALGPYRAHLPAEVYQRLVAEYERRVVAACGRGSPYFLPFNRILIWGRLP